MRKTILVCDVCHKEDDSEQATGWLSIALPEETRFSFNSILPWTGNIYGLYCSIDCLLKRIKQKTKEDSGEYEYGPVLYAGGLIANMTADEVAKWRGDAWNELEKVDDDSQEA